MLKSAFLGSFVVMFMVAQLVERPSSVDSNLALVNFFFLSDNSLIFKANKYNYVTMEFRRQSYFVI